MATDDCGDWGKEKLGHSGIMSVRLYARAYRDLGVDATVQSADLVQTLICTLRGKAKENNNKPFTLA